MCENVHTVWSYTNCCTMQHRTVLAFFPLILQTIIIAQMLSNGGEGPLVLHEYMHRDVYDIHQLRVIDDPQLMTEGVIDDALLQALSHIKHTLIQFFDVIKFGLACSLHTFLIEYCNFLYIVLDCYGHVTLTFTPQERHVICQSFVFLAFLLS